MTELRAGSEATNNMIIIEIITVFLACSKIWYQEGANDVKLKALYKIAFYKEKELMM